MTRLRTAMLGVVALPLLTAAVCGPVVDYTETYLITDPIDRVEIDVDEGTVDAVAYPREALLLKRHTFGFERMLNPADYTVEDGVIHFTASCSKPDVCSFDHMIEAPLGIDYDVRMHEGLLDLGYIDGDVTVALDTGWMRGIRLATPHYSFVADEADVDLDFAAAPELLEIEIGRGEVVIAVPAGAYRCDIDAPGGGSFAGAPVDCDDTATNVLSVRLDGGLLEITGVTP
jgi:hypothetical protein